MDYMHLTLCTTALLVYAAIAQIMIWEGKV